MATTGSGTSHPSASVGTSSLTLDQIITRVRQRLDDTVQPYLWQNSELTEYIDNIQKQIAGEIFAIEDRSTAGICSISVYIGGGIVVINPRIIRVSRASLESKDRPLRIATAEDMDANYPDWDTGTVPNGVPHTLITEGLGSGVARLYPPPDADDTLKLVVYRMPLLDLDYDSHSGQVLEIDRFVHLIYNGVLYQAYTKQDADTADMKKAEYHRILWEGNNGRGGDKDQIRRMNMRYNQSERCAPIMTAFT